MFVIVYLCGDTIIAYLLFCIIFKIFFTYVAQRTWLKSWQRDMAR